jgi:hypothetical protein
MKMTTDIKDTETWDMPVHFKVRQHASGSYWIMIEQLREPTLPILDEGFVGIDLADGTTAKQAKELADLLDERVTHLTYVGPNRTAWVDNAGRAARAKRRKSQSSS